MVRCANCGFLAVRNPQTRTLEEVDEEARGKGTFPSANLGQLSLGLAPRCSRMAADLGAEGIALKETASKQETDGKKIWLTVITKDRDCKAFADWHPGFSPKEHREMIFDSERKRLEMQEKADERRFQARSSLICTLAGAAFGAILYAFASIVITNWTTPKPAPVTQPTQAEKPQGKP